MRLTLLCLLVLAAGCDCGGTATIRMDGGATGGGTGGGAGGGAGGSGGSGGGCVGLQCRQVVCSDGGTTSLTGTVFIPAGTLPLPNVLVYVPNAPLPAVQTGPSCDLCDTAPGGNPLAQQRTDAAGRFRLTNVPAGDAGIPLVLQAGKWRRELTLPAIGACTETELDAGMTRLPRNQSEGHLPKIAIATGGADTLECLLRKLGVDEDEFTLEAGSGRVNLYAGYAGGSTYADGRAFPGTPTLWSSVTSLRRYDLLLLSCEGNTPDPNKTQMAAAEMEKYLGEGGRVFGSHLHQYWVVNASSPMSTVATFGMHPDLMSPFPARVDTSFPRGQEFAQWLVNVNASSTLGQIDINAGQHSIESINPAYATRWIYGTNPQTVQYLSFKAPVGGTPAQQCGRFVLTDIHVSSGDGPGTGFPTGCTTTSLSAQEKALIYMLFDLSNCVPSEIN